MASPTTAWPFPVTDEGRRSATAALVAGNAADSTDARLLWDILGITAEDLAAGRTELHHRKQAGAPAPATAEHQDQENPSVDAFTAVARSMATDGYTAADIATNLDLPESEVATLLTEDDPAEQAPAAADLQELPEDAQIPYTLVEDPGGQQTGGAPADDRLLKVNALLTWALAHQDQAVRTSAEQARTLLLELRDRRSTDAREQELRAAAAELQQRLEAVRAEVEHGLAQVHAELETIGRAARPKPGRRRKTAAADAKAIEHDPKTVRAWARENGYEVAPQGSVPRDIVEAWSQATTRPGLRMAS